MSATAKYEQHENAIAWQPAGEEAFFAIRGGWGNYPHRAEDKRPATQ